MKTKLLTFILAAIMMMTCVVTSPVVAVADGENTWDPDNSIYKITTLADLKAFEAAVEAGNAFDGETITLEADIVLPSDWDGIGGDKTWFAGTFDGQNHTLTMSGHTAVDSWSHAVNGAIFNRLGHIGDSTTEGGTDSVLKNLNVDGYMFHSGNKLGGVVVVQVRGNVLIQNVRCSVKFSTTEDAKTLVYFGGIVGYMRTNNSCTLTMENCVFDGEINGVSVNGIQDCGALFGSTLENTAGTAKHIIMKNCVSAGKITLAGSKSKWVSNFVGYVNGKKTTGEVSLTMTDCVSIGTIEFSESYASDCHVLLGEIGTSSSYDYAQITINNTYYVSQNQADGSAMNAIQKMNKLNGSKVEAKTLEEIAALTADDFTADAKLSFKTSSLDTFYPCPTGLIPENGWLDSLTVKGADAKVLGAQIRITDVADQYSGIRFVSKFRATEALTGAGSEAANFGLILISAEKYSTLTDKTDLTALINAGVKVNAIKVDTSVAGEIGVNAVVYNISVENYQDGIVAVPYVGDAVIGEAVERSIYFVADACSKDATATDLQKNFANSILAAVAG